MPTSVLRSKLGSLKTKLGSNSYKSTSKSAEKASDKSLAAVPPAPPALQRTPTNPLLDNPAAADRMAEITREQAIQAYGWEAVPRKTEELLKLAENVKGTGEVRVFGYGDLETLCPSTDLSRRVKDYAEVHLPRETFNHSMRVFYYGMAIASSIFPSWLTQSFVETYYMTSLLHDIGTTDTNTSSTLLSFEFHGGVTALALFSTLGAPKPQAESVAETIIRHQDLGDTGTVSRNTALILLATLFDNVGGGEELVRKETIESVVERWPRLKWTGCFAATVRREIGQKPWCHSTHIEGFAEKIEANRLMEPYE